MKTIKPIIILIIIVSFLGCGNKKKSSEVAGYTYTEKSAPDAPSALKIAGDWVKEDAECYGLLVAVDKEGRQIHGKPIKAKVVKISVNEIKMKALESVSLAEVKGCTKMGLSKGDTWEEKEGDLFPTKDDAIAFLKEKKLYREKLEVVPARK